MATVLSNEEEHKLCQCRTGSRAVSGRDVVLNGSQREPQLACCMPHILIAGRLHVTHIPAETNRGL